MVMMVNITAGRKVDRISMNYDVFFSKLFVKRGPQFVKLIRFLDRKIEHLLSEEAFFSEPVFSRDIEK